MSDILLITVKDNTYSLLLTHYRDALRKLNKPSQKGAAFLDSGYLLVYHDRATIISSQTAFSPHHIKNRRLKRYSWIAL
jgi:hypothetical protein